MGLYQEWINKDGNKITLDTHSPTHNTEQNDLLTKGYHINRIFTTTPGTVVQGTTSSKELSEKNPLPPQEIKEGKYTKEATNIQAKTISGEPIVIPEITSENYTLIGIVIVIIIIIIGAYFVMKK